MISRRVYKWFEDFDLSRKLQEAVKEAHFDKPTELQRNVIPAALEGKDVIFEARSGMGKSACFAIPFLQHWLRNRDEKAIILTPDAQSAQQLKKVISKLAPTLKAKILSFVGEDDYFFPEFHRKCPIVILELSVGERFFRREQDYIAATKMLGLDQFDKLIEKEDVLSELVSQLSSSRQTLISVESLSEDVIEKARWYCNAGNLEKVQVARPDLNWVGKEVVLQYALVADDNERFKRFVKILDENADKITLVLTDSDRISEYLVDRLKSEAKVSAKLFAYTMPIDEKQKVVQQIIDVGRGIMIGCDAAFNGVSVPVVEHLISWTLPSHLENFWRRIDRFLGGKSLQVTALVDKARAGAIKILERRLERPMKNISPEKSDLNGDDTSQLPTRNGNENNRNERNSKENQQAYNKSEGEKLIPKRFYQPVFAKEEEVKRYTEDGKIRKSLGNKFVPARKKKLY